MTSIIDFYHNKRIFITGHTGFKGSWLSLWLKQLNAKVTGYSLEAEKISLFNLAKIENTIEKSIIGDICDFEHLKAAIKEFRPEIMIHMAAQSLVRRSYLNPLDTYQTNVMGTLNLFEAARDCNSIKAILNITTDKCYENREWLRPYNEDDALGGYDPYSASKACAEILTASHRRSFFEKENVAVATARAGNVIGGGDFSEDRIIPDIIRAIQSKKTVEVRSPNSIRPWQHVLEPLYGYLILTQKLYQSGKTFAKAYNFGPESEAEINVENLTKSLIEKLGYGQYLIGNSSQLHEAKILKLDNSRAKKELGWKPKLSFSDSINFTAEWYKNYLSNAEDIRQFTYKQIFKYNELIS